MSRTAQNILYLAILAIVAIGLFMLAPKQALTLHSIYLPATPHVQHNPTTQASNIVVYRYLPTGAKVLGEIRTMQHYNNTKPSTMKRLERHAIQQARIIAARHGANGLVIHTLGYTPNPGQLDGVVLYGQAILTA